MELGNVASLKNAAITVNPVDELKNRFIDHFILIGSSIFLAVFVFYPWDLSQINADVFIEFGILVFLFTVYGFRNKLPLKLKTSIILIIVCIAFVSDIIQYNVFSTDKVLLVLIPFLSILAYNLLTTTVIFLSSLAAYAVVVFLSLNGYLPAPEFLTTITAGNWIDQIITIIIVAIVLTIFVYNYNKSITKFISDIELSNKELIERDQLLKASLEEKNVMIQEIHHRVKNNLAVVSGLLELQSRQTKNEDMSYILSKSMNRIMSIAKVHEKLYESKNLNDIPVENYIKELTEMIVASFNDEFKKIEFDFDVQLESLNVNHGVPLGIILNELITNSIKYGFGDSSQILISVSIIQDGDTIKVLYSDNGIGIDDFESTTKKSLGFKLIYSLFDQLEASYSFETNNKFLVEFSFPGIMPADVFTS